MILVRERRTKQREDSVAGGLHNVAVVPADRIDHQLERGIDDRARLFRIYILLKLGLSLDVGKQRRDRLALTVERGCVFGRGDAHIGSCGFDWPRCWRGGNERRTAISAELPVECVV